MASQSHVARSVAADKAGCAIRAKKRAVGSIISESVDERQGEGEGEGGRVREVIAE